MLSADADTAGGAIGGGSTGSVRWKTACAELVISLDEIN